MLWGGRWEGGSCLGMHVRIKDLKLKKKKKNRMEQQTGSKSGKECVKAVYCHPAYLTSVQSTYEKHWAGGSTSWN